jgi:hypothetical protein
MATMGSKAIAVTEPENRCPECLHLEISGEIVAAKNRKKPEPEKINLFVRINFNEQWVDFNFGRVKFGLRGGELRLKLENGKMPSELRNKDLKKSLETKLTKERQSVVETENKPLIEASLGPDLTKVGLKVNLGNNQKNSRCDKFQFEIAQISHKGADDQPVWVFENKTGEPVLIGELADSLGKMLIETTPCQLEAKFISEMRQVVITGLENFLRDDISRSQFKALELKFAKSLLKQKTQPYLSHQVLRYD